MPVILNTLLVKLFTDSTTCCVCFFNKLFLRTLCSPLERSKWLGNKERCAGYNLYLTVSLFLGNCLIICSSNFIGKLCNSLNIFFCFCWKSKHEIKLYTIPATFKGFCSTFENHFFCQSLINNVTKTLASCFRCKSKAALFNILYLLHNIQ